MTLSPRTAMIYEITVVADDLISQKARRDHCEITAAHIQSCVTACVQQMMPNHPEAWDEIITHIIKYQFEDWLPNLEESEN